MVPRFFCYNQLLVRFRGAIVNRTYGTHKKNYIPGIYLFFANNIWSYLLWSLVLNHFCEELYWAVWAGTVAVVRLHLPFNPFRTAVPFWGTNYLECEWFVPKTGLRF